MKATHAIYSVLPAAVYLRLRWSAYRIARPTTFPYRQDKRIRTANNGYSLKPFDETRSIFVHIPKCAGVSVCKALYGNLAGGHTTLDDYLTIFEPRCIERYFKFSVVRNPWDRLVSAYHFLRNGGFSEANSRWFDDELGVYKDFDDFVRNWVTPENIWKYHHFIPQYHYILDKHRKIQVDFLACFENLRDDFATISSHFSEGPRPLLPKANTAQRSGYLGYYTEETAAIVARAYATDIDLLGYNFDNSSLPEQLSRRRDNGGSSLRAGRFRHSRT